MDYKAVFFDFDYTLGDATEAIVAGFQYAFAKMGLPEPEREAVRRTIGMMLEDEYTVLTGRQRPGKPRPLPEAVHREGRPPPGGEHPALPRRGGAAHRPAPAGHPRRHRQHQKDRHPPGRAAGPGRGPPAHLHRGGDQCAAPKPDPQGLLASVNALGLAPAEVLFCGDTTIDGETARRAGTHFCAVLNGTTGAGGVPGRPGALRPHGRLPVGSQAVAGPQLNHSTGRAAPLGPPVFLPGTMNIV